MGVEGEERKKRKKEKQKQTDTEPHRTTLHHITHNTTHTTEHSYVTKLEVFIINFAVTLHNSPV